MVEEARELWRFRDLLRQMVVRELKIRYAKSVLGFVWSIVPPLLQVLVFTFLIRGVMNSNIPNYSAYALCGLIPWTFLSSAILDSSHSLLDNYGVIRKVYLPREIIPLANVLSNFVHFLLAWALYFAIFFGLWHAIGLALPLQTGIVWFPVITLFLALFVTGVALWVAALNIFYPDVKFITTTVLQLALFLVPVIYPAESFHNLRTVRAHPWAFKLYMLNPITAMIDAYRKTLLQPVPAGTFGSVARPLTMDWPLFAGSCVLSVLVAWGGYAYFNSRKWQFVEYA